MDQTTVDGITEWQEAASDAFVPLRVSGPRNFSGTLHGRRLSDDLTVTRIRTGTHDVARTRRMIATDGCDDLLLTVQLGGGGHLAQHGRTAPTPAGTCVLYETNEPYDIHLPSSGQDLVVTKFSRRLVGLPDHVIERSVARTIGPEMPGQAPLAAYLASLRSQDGQAPGAGPSLGAIAGQLLSVVLASLHAGGRPAESPRVAQLAAMRATLQNRLSDPWLGVEQLAEQHFVSVRQVYALFAEDDDSPGAYLRRVRLERAASLLTGSPGSSVRSVAEHCGYSDAAAFTRAFTRRYGCPPSRWAASDGS